VALGLGASLLVVRIGTWAADPRAHDRPHERAAHAHPHDHEHDDHEHDDREHGRGLFRHSHAAPDAPVLSPRGLLALALAGGILPSPTALVVLLSAVSFHRVGFGLALIAAFSAGLAAALVVVGLVAIRARDAVAGRLGAGAGRLIPVASAAAIATVGIVLTVRGALQL